MQSQIDRAEHLLTEARKILSQVRDSELSSARACAGAPGMDDRHRRHMMATRVLVIADQHIREALEVLT